MSRRIPTFVNDFCRPSANQGPMIGYVHPAGWSGRRPPTHQERAPETRVSRITCHRLASYDVVYTMDGARRGGARQGAARQGAAGRGESWQGMEHQI